MSGLERGQGNCIPLMFPPPVAALPADGRGLAARGRPAASACAGSAIPRTIVASSAIAAASPNPSCLNDTSGSVAKIANTATITTAALVTVAPVPARASAAASLADAPWRRASAARSRISTV